MLKRVFLYISVVFIFLFSQTNTFGQNYGNEWIKSGQKYFKVKIAQEGIFRIDFTALSTVMFQSGVDISMINPRKIQVFNNGQEIPIYLHGESDGVFNFDDFIEFYAFKNDGKLDRELFYFNSEKDPLHDFESMFSDTSAYYITYLPNSSAQNGLRFQLLRNHSSAGLSDADYFMFSSRRVFNNVYYGGHPFIIQNTALFQPEYSQGEGYVGTRFGFGPSMQSIIKQELTMPAAFSSGPQPTLEFKVVASTSNVTFSPDHHLKIGVGGDNTLFNTIYDTTSNGYGVLHKKMSFSPGFIGSSNTCFVQMEAVNISGLALQGFNASFLELNYAREFNLAGFTNLQGEMPASASAQWVRWSNYGISGNNRPLVYDLENRRRITPQFGANQSFSYANPASANPARFVIADSLQGQFITAIEPVTFFDFVEPVNNTQFLILTAQRLLGSEANDYLNYRKTTYAANMYTVEQLYDAFTYGVRHPIAIRRFLKYLTEQSSTLKPEYLLFLGRGIQPDLLRNPNFASLNAVPTLGTPASDALFSAGLGGKDTLVPLLATGRVTVDNKSHIAIYLRKLIEQEQAPNAHWKKQIMHLGGGKDGSESRIIRSFLESFESFSKKDPFGGFTQGFYRSGTDAVSELNLRTRAINLMNEGVSLVTFLGHGSAAVLDIDIGDTIDYNNAGKNPVMYFNGCRVGNPAIGFNNGNLFFGERMIRGNRRGAVVFMGQSSTSELYTVAGQMQVFYRQMFESNVGQTVGNIWRESIEKNLNIRSNLSRYHNMILFYQGDPAFSFYSPTLPDYFVTSNSLFLSPENTNALSDSFNLGIIVGNIGKYIPGDSFNIRVKRTWPNESKVEEYVFRVNSVSFKDTFFFTFKTKDIATTGNNLFEVFINYDRNVEESNYANNDVKLQRFIEGNGVRLVYPERYAIHSKADSVKLVAQSLNLLRVNNQFIFEIDTTPRYNSPWLRRTQPAITTGNLAEWSVPILPNDSQVYYWRARLNLPTNQGGFWEERSFIYIKNGQHGWSQSHHPECYPSSTTQRIVFDTIGRRFEFDRTERFVWVDTRVNSHSNLGVKFAGFASQDVNPGAGGSFVAVLLDRNTLTQFLHPNHYPKCWRGATWPPFQAAEQNAYYCFGNNANDIADFKALVNDIPEGTYVAFFTRYDSNIGGWSEDLKSVLRSLGGTKFEGYTKNQTSYVLIGQKSNSPLAFEDMSHLIDSSTAGYAAIEGRILGRHNKGTLASELIGPAEKWSSVFVDWRPTQEIPNNDELTYSIYGIDTAKQKVLLHDNLNATNFDISNIDAQRFRFIQLESTFTDLTDRSAPQLRHWLVTYDELPEGTINSAIQFVFHKDTLQEGDSFKTQIAFQNISSKPMDSVYCAFQLIDVSTQTVLKSTSHTLAPIGPGEFVFLNESYNTVGLSGFYMTTIAFNKDMKQPEVSLSNNFLSIPFYVVNDHLNPLLDVTFDGRHIINSEIVSPNPLILITSKDENPFLLQNDSANFELMLKRPGMQSFERIDMADGEVHFKPAINSQNMARIEYRPVELSDGMYTLKVQSTDMSGNIAGKEHYSIDFQVVNESAITHFYPYPNPFTTQMRFVFTLTGKEIPDDIFIKIMTVSGRVVREINKDELGMIRIGNNISEFSWDGTDQYGDRLANGVYLYQVTVRKSGEQLKRRNSAGDNSFKKDVGKIYLLR